MFCADATRERAERNLGQGLRGPLTARPLLFRHHVNAIPPGGVPNMSRLSRARITPAGEPSGNTSLNATDVAG